MKSSFVIEFNSTLINKCIKLDPETICIAAQLRQIPTSPWPDGTGHCQSQCSLVLGEGVAFTQQLIPLAACEWSDLPCIVSSPMQLEGFSKQPDGLHACALSTAQLSGFPAFQLSAPQPYRQGLFVCLSLTRVCGKVKEMDLWFNNIFETLFKHVL